MAWPAAAAQQPRGATAAGPPAPATFQQFCFECHGGTMRFGNMSVETLLRRSAASTPGDYSEDWSKVAEMLESRMMPPLGIAKKFPSDDERATAVAWIRDVLRRHEAANPADPGKVTVRRLTSAEYGYAIRDLTGVEIKVGIDTSSDSVGGEGFTNFGDVQFVQDTSVERYLEAAKQAADHAVIGAGPLEFYTDAGKTGLELSAWNRINDLYTQKGFRVVSGEGGAPFGLERYGKAFYVSWYYKHRVALGDPGATLRGLAVKEGITGRFAEHVWAVLNKPAAGYPLRTTVDGWKQLKAPGADVPASLAAARTGTEALYKALTRWPSWFFARGDLAAGGRGDESPLVFDDTSLKASPTHKYSYVVGTRGRPGAPRAAGPAKVHISFASVNPGPGMAVPVVIWRNPRIVTRAAPQPPAAGAPEVPPAALIAAEVSGQVLANEPLRSVLPAETAEALKFGQSPDGTAVGADDFATSGDVSFTIDVPAGKVVELQADAELGSERNAVLRVMISDRPEGSPRDQRHRVLFGDPQSAGYRRFRAAIDEYVAALPPNSHGEVNPADKDPVPAPFDNTYNSREHDAFVLLVKYQRNDRFFTDNVLDGADRARLNQAWSDLFASWPYHDAYLGMLIDHFSLPVQSRRIQDMDAARIAALPAAARPYVTTLRAHYDQVMETQRLAQPGHVTGALELAGRAWRRPLSLTEKTSLRAFYQKARSANGLGHDAAVRALLARILMSPAFLYRMENQVAGPVAPLNAWELASRMSFFLWSSVPDDELRRAAAAGELSDPAKLAQQVKRMAADPKARRLATEFFGQWLGFYHFDDHRGVDTGRFAEFTDEVKESMYDEAISFFEHIVRQDRPVREILHADYTFLNKPLAKFYGIAPEVKAADKMELVKGAGAFGRGGALRLGSVLTATSAPLRTSPVKRGDWVLRRILGTPTPPPPADAGTIPADDKTFNGLTVRERLAQHKRNASCAGCHVRIDPLGFPLEGFDAVGRARATYADGKPVDSIGELPDGTTIAGAAGLLTYLESQDKQVMTMLAKKLLGYALGRTVLVSDRRLVDEMARAGGSAPFSQLAVKVVQSRQFRNRAGDAVVDAPSAPSDVGSR